MIERRLREAAEEIRNYVAVRLRAGEPGSGSFGGNSVARSSVPTQAPEPDGAARSARFWRRFESDGRYKSMADRFRTNASVHHSRRSGGQRLPLHHRRRQARAAVAERRAQSFLPTTSKKPTVTAMEEVRRGLVKYEDIAIDRMLAAAVRRIDWFYPVERHERCPRRRRRHRRVQSGGAGTRADGARLLACRW